MCFKNLPVEFDENGNASLKPGVADPYSYDVQEVTPLSEDPTASVMNTSGSSSKSWSFITGENTAAVELTATSDEVS